MTLRELYAYFNGEELEALLLRYEAARLRWLQSHPEAWIDAPMYREIVERINAIETVANEKARYNV